jgi:hypothetical protein
VQLGALGGAPAALAGNDFVVLGSLGMWANNQRLDHALFADRSSELVERGLIEAAAWLLGIGVKPLDRNVLVGGFRGPAVAAA